MQRIHPFLIKAALAATLAFNVIAAQAESSLWKVSSKKGTVYLQGSSHALKQEHYPLAPEIEAAYSNSTALILEVDMKEMLSPKTQQLIMTKAMLEQPDTLKTILSPATYERLESACKEVGLPMEAIQQFKPWFATMTLTMVSMQRLGFNAENGLDTYFYDKATADSKNVIGLETLEMQIGLFDSLAQTNPDDFVNRSLAEIKLMEPQFKELMKAWETGDMETMDKLINESFKDYPELHAKFVTDRNKAWAKKLSEIIRKDETYMVVVGVGHLCGEEGLVKLLEKQGFTVEQM